MPSSQINSSGYHSIKGRTRLDEVELEKCGGEHGIKWGRTRKDELDRGRTRCNSVENVRNRLIFFGYDKEQLNSMCFTFDS